MFCYAMCNLTRYNQLALSCPAIIIFHYHLMAHHVDSAATKGGSGQNCLSSTMSRCLGMMCNGFARAPPVILKCFGMVWFRQVWNGLDCFQMVWSDLECLGMPWNGLELFGMDLGKAWKNWNGLVWHVGHIWFGIYENIYTITRT